VVRHLLITREVIERLRVIAIITIISLAAMVCRHSRRKGGTDAVMFNTRNKELGMHRFTLHTIESAPEKSRQTLQALEQKFGFLPNVMATMAESPVLLNGFAGSFGNFHGGSFNECEKQVLLLTNAVTFKCPWTVAAHSTFALEDGVPEADVNAIRAGKLPQDPKYAALSAMSRALIEKRGNLAETDIENFTSAGYSQVQIFEVITSTGVSTMAATATNMARTPVEDRLKAQAWTPA
jgi:alkylhydroperoxidase family enzyme